MARASDITGITILGDSNVVRNMTPFNCRDRPLMKGAQCLPCGRFELLAECLRKISNESNVVIISCVTNFLTGSGNVQGSISQRVEGILIELVRLVNGAACEKPDLLFLISPPMYRMFPIWYRDGLPEVLKKFSETMVQKVKNVHLLPSFATPSFEADGVHLTAYSGLEFVVFLFDSSVNLVETISSQPEEVLLKNCESSRVLEDRMMALEQDHHRLNSVVEFKTAEDAELAEMHENIMFEDCFMISGLPRLPKLSPKEWQDRARADVAGVLKVVFPNRTFKIVFVKNASGPNLEKPARYQVKMDSVASSKEIRDKFGSFFKGGKKAVPNAIKDVSIRNRLTHESRVRLMIMRVLADHYLESNPGAKVHLIKYDSRPIMKLVPPEGAKDPRIQTLNYIEAVKSLPVLFSDEELEPILREIKPKWHGRVRSLFIVISDDMIKKKFRQRNRGAAGSSGNVAEDDADDGDADQEQEAGGSDAPPSNSRSRGQKSGQKSGSKSGSRAGKRGPSPSAQSGPEKKK